MEAVALFVLICSLFHFHCSSPIPVNVIKSRKMRWMGHVALMGESHLENLGVNKRFMYDR
jgi:hypothetical protein